MSKDPTIHGVMDDESIDSSIAGNKRQQDSEHKKRQVPGIKPLWLVEKEAIENAIALLNGNIPRAAAALEISASTIYRKRAAWDEKLNI